MIIYKYTNLINGKVYIGQTVDEVKRKKSHLLSVKRGSKLSFHCAIRKYGIVNFSYEVIDGANSNSELNYKEIHHIHLNGCLAPNGYNLRLGNQPTPSMQRQVIAINELTGIETVYRSVSQCERLLCIPRNTVYEILNGRRKYVARSGYFFKYKDTEPNKKILKIKEERNVKRIDPKTNEEKIYLSAKLASVDGFNPDLIRNVCTRKTSGLRKARATYKKYFWEYA